VPYHYLKSPTRNCPSGRGIQRVKLTLPNGAEFFSIGIQNFANVADFSAMQLFIMDSRNAFIEVVNNSFNDVEWCARYVVHTTTQQELDASQINEECFGPEKIENPKAN
jgi:hypothetical protein